MSIIQFGSRSGWRVLATAALLASTACATQATIDPIAAPPAEASPAIVPADPNAWPAVRSRVPINPAQEARIADLSAQLKAAEKTIAQYESARLTERVPALVAAATTLGGYTVVAENLGALGSADDVRMLATSVRGRLNDGPTVVVLAAEVAGKATVIVATTPAARDAGAKAGALARTASGVLGGGGGGKDDLAQGGGADPSAIPAAIEAVLAELRH